MNIQKNLSLFAIFAFLFSSPIAAATTEEETCPTTVGKRPTIFVTEEFRDLHRDLKKLDSDRKGEAIVEEAFKLFSALVGTDHVHLYKTANKSLNGIDLVFVDHRSDSNFVIFIESKFRTKSGAGRPGGAGSTQLSRDWISKNLKFKNHHQRWWYENVKRSKR
jgi:hypothetical protein